MVRRPCRRGLCRPSQRGRRGRRGRRWPRPRAELRQPVSGTAARLPARGTPRRSRSPAEERSRPSAPAPPAAEALESAPSAAPGSRSAPGSSSACFSWSSFWSYCVLPRQPNTAIIKMLCFVKRVNSGKHCGQRHKCLT